MTNRGVTPVDPDTLVGQFRNAYGDTQYVPLDPPELGYGDYTELSDDEIEGFLLQGSDNVNRAIGYYYIRLSGEASKLSKLTKDYDLTVDLTKRANDLRETAKIYFDAAAAEDVVSGATDLFDSFKFVTEPSRTPEAAPPVEIDIY